MRKLMSYLLVCLLAVGLLAGSALAEGKTMQVSVDPRIELLSVVQLLSGYGERGILTRFDLEYKQDIVEYFAPYQEHQAVKMFAKMSKKGFSYDAPPTTMLFLSNPPELKKEIPFTDYLKKRTGALFGGWKLSQFVDALRDFAQESNFMEFYNQHQDFYQQIIRQTEASIIGENYIQTLEDYYGMSQHSYNVILAPLFHPGGYGPRVERADGRYDIYNITGPMQMNEGTPVFGSKGQFRYLAWHEFGHSFVNPTTAEHSKEVNQYQSLYQPIADQMNQQAYNNWETVVNEHLVRAVTTRLAELKFGREEGERILKYEQGRGFAYIDGLIEALARYEENRDQYPTFKDFYPELVQVFEDFASRDLGSDFYFVAFDGTINGAVKNKGDVVLIIPTNEADQGAEDGIREYVEKFKERFFPTAALLTDTEALETDLANKVPVVFGTVEGNLWLKQYIDQLPFSLNETQLTVMDQVFEGEGLKLLTAVPSPFDPQRGMVIYTAQRAQDVININNIFHGPTGYVVVRGDEVLKSGNYE